MLKLLYDKDYAVNITIQIWLTKRFSLNGVTSTVWLKRYDVKRIDSRLSHIQYEDNIMNEFFSQN